MDPVTTALAVFALMLAVLASGMWVFLALATAAAISLFAFMGFPPDKIGAIASRIIVRSASSWELAAVPMFI
ncbi:C4-dicarboxylate ABC transporter permease, partial [Rhodobacteraceae bacterium R_SAG1]|nr:C4-dicarboxylate ABC transporter permease [Rhodobacteraceae bacterium R_SAG1]